MPHPAQITVIECPQIGNAIFQHGNTFDSHAKGKPLIFVRVIATIFQHPRIDHARAKNFQPVITSANFQTATITRTANINFGRRLGKGEIAGAETHRQIVNAKECSAEIDQTPFKMPHMDAIPDHQTFALMKHRRMGGVMIRAIGTARHNNPDWRFAGFHCAYLYRRCMGAQNLAFALVIRWQIEGIMFLTRGMFFGNIQRGKIIIIRLDIGAFGNGKAHFSKNRDHFFDCA